MPETFLHGVEVVEIDTGARPIRSVRSGVIGIVGTAPDSAPDVKATLSTGVVASNNALTFTSKLAGILGNAISVQLRNPGTANATLSVAVTGNAIVVNLATNASSVITSTAAQVIAAIIASTAANALVAVANTAGSTGASAVTAVAATFLTGGIDEPFPLNTPVLIAGSRAEAANLDTTGLRRGTLPNAIDLILDQIGAVIVVVRVAEGANDAATQTNVIGGVDAGTGQYLGVQALLGAESVIGFAPRILLAPGFTHQRSTGNANPVIAELVGIAERLRAVIIADGPNTTDAAAIAAAGDWGTPRVYMVDPWVKVQRGEVINNEPASSVVAGLIAKSDNDRGFWWSPSNQTINGIVGTSRPVDFKLGDANSRANLLNEQNVTTIIREDGYRLWGNRTLSADPKWAFLSVRRTADILNESLQRAHLWAVDRNITKTYLRDVEEGVNAYIRSLVAQGALIGGRCWADPDLNSPLNIAQGKVFFNFDFTPPYPAEHITFRSILTNDYLEELV